MTTAVETMSDRPEDDPNATDDVIHHEHEPHPSSIDADHASDDEVLDEEEVVEKDTRTFFFRHVTMFVKAWGLLTLAG